MVTALAAAAIFLAGGVSIFHGANRTPVAATSPVRVADQIV